MSMSKVHPNGCSNAHAADIPIVQTVAIVNELGGEVTFREDYPVPSAGNNEVLAKVLYTGVCQSDLHTKEGTAAGFDGKPITNIKLPHVGGHEGVGRIVALGPNCSDDIRVGQFVGIRFASRICRRCEYCLAGQEQHCVRGTNHLHHEDGCFQQYIALDANYITLLPDDINPQTIGPTLCAGVTAYKAVLNSNVRAGQWLVVVGAAGGLGHMAVQYGLALGAQVLGIDGGRAKADFVLNELGAQAFLDYTTTKDIVREAINITGGGAHAVVVTATSSRAFAQGADMLRVGGTLSCVGIPPGNVFLETPICAIIIKGLHITGNLVGSLKDCLDAVEFVRRGVVRPKISVRPFRELPEAYKELVRGEVSGRIVLDIGSE